MSVDQWQELVTVHEAGHAVMGALCGWGSATIQVHENGGEDAAECRFDPVPAGVNVLDAMCVALAGIAAEALAGPFPAPDLSWAGVEAGECPSVGAEDLARVRALATEHGAEADLVDVWTLTVDRLRPHTERIRALARELRAAEKPQEAR